MLTIINRWAGKSLVKLNNLFFQKDLNQVDFLVFFVLYPLMFVSYAKVKKQLKIYSCLINPKVKILNNKSEIKRQLYKGAACSGTHNTVENDIKQLYACFE